MSEFYCELHEADGELSGWVRVDAQELPDLLVVEGEEDLPPTYYILDQKEILLRRYYRATVAGARGVIRLPHEAGD